MKNNLELLRQIFGDRACMDIDESINNNDELNTLAEEVLSELAPANKNAVELVCYEGKSIKEISKIMEASYEEVQQFFAIGIRNLRHPKRSKRLSKFVNHIE